ncbi:hypothetical protein BGZ75_003118 [Mortierella antarctica]|nr:hypothetical protein BGZ75_003118 [Mortierella antarctica]
MSSVFSSTAAAVAAATSSPDPSTVQNHARNGAFNSGGYIYMILLAGVLTGVIYFARVCLAKRQARHRALKNPDFDGPPTYLHHLQDLQVIDARPRTTAASGQLVIPSAPASALIRGENYYIVTPRTHSRTGSAASSLSRPRSLAQGTSGAGPGAGSPRNTTISAPTTTTSSGAASVEPLPPAYEDLGSAPLVAPSTPPSTGLSSA